MPVIDADTHIVEAECIWDCLDPKDRDFRPVTVTVDELPGELKQRAMAGRKFWLVDGRMYGMGGLHSNSYAPGTRDLTDAAARVAHMDKLSIDVQVIYPSVFLNLIVAKPDAELALAKAYNRWVAEACRPHRSRLRWLVAVAPRAIDGSLEQIAWAKDNGAVGVILHGYEGDKTLDDPMFYPIYAKAAELDMPICVHIGTNSPHFQAMEHGLGGRPNIVAVIMPTVVAFSALMLSAVPEKFPSLRFGFIEGGSEWVPLPSRAERPIISGPRTLPSACSRTIRFYVTCEAHERLAAHSRCGGGGQSGHRHGLRPFRYQYRAARAPYPERTYRCAARYQRAHIVSDCQRLYGL